MTPNRITIKFFIDPENEEPLPDLVPVFHRWIQEDAVPGLLIDVADYRHVPEGPGLLLVGHEVDYGLDYSHGRAGFLTRRKRLFSGGLAQDLAQTLDWAVTAAQQLRQDAGLRLRPDHLAISFPDRLQAPNEPATAVAYQAALESVLGTVLGAHAFEVVAEIEDRRLPLAFWVAIDPEMSWANWAPTAVAV